MEYRKHLMPIGLMVVMIMLIASACLGPAPAPSQVPETTTEAPAVETATAATESSSPAAKVPPTRSVPAGTFLLNTTGTLAGPKGGRLEYTFDANADQPIRIEVSLNNGTPEYEFRLIDKYGNILAFYKSDPSKLSEAISEISVPYAATYKIVVLPVEGDGTLGVKVITLGAPTGGGSIEPGTTAQALMGGPRTYHTYRFNLTAGEIVSLKAGADTPNVPDLSFILYGPDGHYLSDADDVNPPADLDAVLSGFSAPLDGEYTALVTNQGEGTGAYTFSVNVDSAAGATGPADVVYDKDYRANFGDQSNLDATFDGAIGDILKIEATDVDPGLSLDIYLYSPLGQIIAYAANASKGKNTAVNEIQLPYTGRFKLEMRPSGDGQASFKITHLLQPPTGGGILTDAKNKLPGRISGANIFHVYQFDAQAGDLISLAAFSVSKGGALDLGFALIGPNGRQLAFADDSQSQFPKDPALTDFEIMQSGTYTVIVYSFTSATGTYDMVFTRK